MRGIEKINVPKLNRSLFDMSREWKGTCGLGYLYPVFVEDVLPGDSFNIKPEVYVRLQPLVAPLMHKIRVFVHYFYVQNRTLATATENTESMNDWEKIITGGEDGDDTTLMPFVYMSESDKAYFYEGTVPNCMGIQALQSGTTYTNTLKLNSLPFRAYQKIWDEFYRDPNIQNPSGVDYADTGQEADYDAVTTLRKRLWLKDYFTTATPWAVRGTDTGIPMEMTYDGEQFLKKYAGGTAPGAGDAGAGAAGRFEMTSGADSGAAVGLTNFLDDSSIDVRELRNSLRVTEWLEKNVKAGGRYVDQLLVHWGVTIPDLNFRPKYIGGGQVNVQINEVLNTSDTTNAEQGNPAGTGIGYGNVGNISCESVDHGWIIGVLSLMAENGYTQGVPRKFTRMDKFDYAWPEFASIGDQEILKQELWLGTDLAGSSGTFGYTPRYQEYKESYNWACMGMADDYDHWHLNRQFSTLPALNEAFLTHTPRVGDIFPTSITDDYFLVQTWHDVRALRPLPYESTPGII